MLKFCNRLLYTVLEFLSNETMKNLCCHFPLKVCNLDTLIFIKVLRGLKYVFYIILYVYSSVHFMLTMKILPDLYLRSYVMASTEKNLLLIYGMV